MTLREIGRSISDAGNDLLVLIETSRWTISNLSPVDWPLWLLGIVGLFVLLMLRFVLSMLQFLLGEHQTDDGRVRRGLAIVGLEIIEVARYLLIWGSFWAAMLAWVGLVAVSLITLLSVEAIYPHWYGAIGLLIAAGLAVAARLGFRAYDRRNPDEVERPED